MLSLHADPLLGKKDFRYLKQTGVYTSDAFLDMCKDRLSKSLLLSKHFKLP